MSRPRKRMAFALLFVVALWTMGALFPRQIALFVALLLLGLSAYVVDNRAYFLGRRCMRKARWDEALTSLRVFEEKLMRSPMRERLGLYVSLYTSSGLAGVRNNIGVVMMNLGELGDAEAVLKQSLQNDPHYALPHVNLAIVLALQGDTEGAAAAVENAQRLGFRTTGVQAKIRHILSSTNPKLGSPFDAASRP